MATKRYAVVTVITSQKTYTFGSSSDMIGQSVAAQIEAFQPVKAITNIADEGEDAVNATVIIPYHAIVSAEIVWSTAEAKDVVDAVCPVEETP